MTWMMKMTTVTQETPAPEDKEKKFHRELPDKPVWDPIEQVYVGGVLPEHDDEAIRDLLEQQRRDGGPLRFFGYGSLCWGTDESILSHERTTQAPAHVVSDGSGGSGYRRCWAQKSMDHRGTPGFPGVVCTLLTPEEMGLEESDSETTAETSSVSSSITSSSSSTTAAARGVVYRVPFELTQACLAELDFRERGGYARDVVTVLEEDTGETHPALLYRATPDNPAFWPRGLKDLPFAAAVMAKAVGPSGENWVYLSQMSEFLRAAGADGKGQNITTSTDIIQSEGDDTIMLAIMMEQLRDRRLMFLMGCGSNQHNQLMLQSYREGLVDGEDAYDMTELVVCSEQTVGVDDDDDPVIEILAGGGHSGLITRSGQLYLFGWNESGQLGYCDSRSETADSELPLKAVSSLANIRVSSCSLGFSHSAVIERDTEKLFCFGSNQRGQVDPQTTTKTITSPICPLGDERVQQVSAGLFHTCVILAETGELLTLGTAKHGTLSSRWKPPPMEGTSERVEPVVCKLVGTGAKHTVVVDSSNRVWTFGSNKYGQLGIGDLGVQELSTPTLLDYDWAGKIESVQCGWSHTIVTVRSETTDKLQVYGWGRNDKGQLGTGVPSSNTQPSDSIENSPIRLWGAHNVASTQCGSESSHFVDTCNQIWGCGWNEHGNLGLGNNEEHIFVPTMVKDAAVITTPRYETEDTKLMIAAGGGHLLAMKVSAGDDTR